ncbi:PRTRC system protein E [Paraburkholderia megapolitana]|uniref:PRTRC system protein E n=1 Tax=Paraburkholderia megapolitana TaxID=420953 RepID=UPI0038BAB628
MFQALEALTREVGKISLSMTVKDDTMVVVVVPQGESKEAALRQPLVLAGSPAELEAGFGEAVQSFSTAHRSLADQVAATTAILQASEKSQAGKAQKALQKKSTPALAAPAKGTASDGDDDADDTEDESTGTTPLATTATESKPAGTDLQALLL